MTINLYKQDAGSRDRNSVAAISSPDVSSIIEDMADQLTLNRKVNIWESENQCDGNMKYEEDPQIKIEYDCKGIISTVWTTSLEDLFHSLVRSQSNNDIHNFIIWLSEKYLEKKTFTPQEWKIYLDQNLRSSGIPLAARGLFVENVVIAASRKGEGKAFSDLKRLIILYSQAQRLKPTI